MLIRYVLLCYIIAFGKVSVVYAEDAAPELPDFSLYSGGATSEATKAPAASPAGNKPTKSTAYDIDVKTQAVPSYVLDMLNSQNVDINTLANNKADEQLEKQKADLQKKKQEQDKQDKVNLEAKMKEEEASKKLVEQEAKKQAALLEEEYRTFYYRPKYDSILAKEEDQIHKRNYGPNNQHLVGFLNNDDYSSYLFVAVIEQDIPAIKGLLDKGANINARDAKNGYTALMYAVKNGKNASIDYLVSKGADLMVQATDGSTALHIAMRCKNIDAIKSLLYFKPSVETKDSTGNTPIMLAVNLPNSVNDLVFDLYSNYDQALLDFSNLGNFSFMQKAIKKGGDVNVRDKDGNTPLMLVIKHKDPQLVALLLQENPDVNVLNNDGLSAINITENHGDEYVWSLIKTYIDKKELDSQTQTIVYKKEYIVAPHHKALHYKKVEFQDKPNSVKSRNGVVKKPISLIPSDKK